LAVKEFKLETRNSELPGLAQVTQAKITRKKKGDPSRKVPRIAESAI